MHDGGRKKKKGNVTMRDQNVTVGHKDELRERRSGKERKQGKKGIEKRKKEENRERMKSIDRNLLRM